MTPPKHPRLRAVALALMAVAPCAARAQSAVGSGQQMVGVFGPPKARTQITAGTQPDNYRVSLKRNGACNGEFAGPARAYNSNVVTSSEKDRDSGTTCTINITYEPDFTANTVRESAACLTYHGAGCNFEGQFKRSR